MKEIDAIIETLEEDLNKILKRKKGNKSKKEGDMGEEFVKSAIKQSFWEKGYKIGEKGKGSYRVHKQVKANKNGMGGVDFFVEYTDEKGNTSGIFVESKNWKAYRGGVSNKFYNDEIKDRFERADSKKKFPHAVTMNKGNIPSIKDRCDNDDITPLPLDDKLTEDNIDAKSLKPIYENFKRSFTDYIKDIVPDVNKDCQIEESIESDILIGKDYRVIAKKWGVSVKYVRNVAIKLGIPDRRKKSWRVISLIRYKEV